MSTGLLIDDCMAPSPYSIEKGASLAQARELMERHLIRHLPVMDGETLVGMLSTRDLHLLQALDDHDPGNVQITAAISEPPYTVQIGTQLRNVVVYMAAKKYGAAIVLDGTKVVGLFTTVDALRVLSNLL